MKESKDTQKRKFEKSTMNSYIINPINCYKTKKEIKWSVKALQSRNL